MIRIRKFITEMSAEERFDIVGTVLIWVLITAVFVGLPLFLRNKYEYIASGKFMLFLEIGRWTAIIMGLFASAYFAGRGLSGAEIKAFRRIRYVDLFVLAYILVSSVSYGFSKYKFMGDAATETYPEGAFWGVSGWFMGIITYAILVIFYLAVSRFFLYSEKFLIPALFAAEIVFLWGMLNRFRFSIFDFDGKDPKFIASIGNINWFIGYVSVIVPLMTGLYWYKGNRNRLLYGSLLFSGFLTVIINGSDSGILAIFLMLLFLFVYSLKSEEHAVCFSEIALIFAGADILISVLHVIFKYFLSFEGMLTKILIDIRVAPLILAAAVFFFFYLRINKEKERPYPQFLRDKLGKISVLATISFFLLVIVLIVVNTALGGTLPLIGKIGFFNFNREWGTLRGTDWEVAVRLFAKQDILRKFIGSGPDTFYFFYMDHVEIHNMIVEQFHWTRLTNAHCEWLSILVNQGILGVITYAGISVSMFIVLYKRVRERPDFMMFILVIIMYHANNLISFEQITSTPFFYLILGIGAAAVVAGEKPVRG